VRGGEGRKNREEKEGREREREREGGRERGVGGREERCMCDEQEKGKEREQRERGRREREKREREKREGGIDRGKDIPHNPNREATKRQEAGV
jgi:hypothetical protein